PDSLQLRVTVKGEVLTLDASILATTRQRILKRNRYNDGREAVEVSLRDQLWARVPADVLAAHDLTRDDFDELVSSQASWRML
ncbi:helicase, partial [Xanthomonas citri pv. citri]|nr:helicase [Xanthomonas citri pv. citri]